MKKNKYNDDIYSMYEKEVNKNKLLTKEYASLKLEECILKRKINETKNKIDNEINREIKFYNEENNKLQKDLSAAYEEIVRLKAEINSNTEDNN